MVTKAPRVAKAAPVKAAAAAKRPTVRQARTSRPAAGVAMAVEKLLTTVDLDEAGEAKAAIARALATKLDQATASDAGPVAMSMAGIAKELREVVDAILEASDDDGAFVADLFQRPGTVG